jgi:hypothetical protein
MQLIFSAVVAKQMNKQKLQGLMICFDPRFRAALHLEAMLIRCVRGSKSSLVIGQKAKIRPNLFTPRGRADLVV